MNKHKLLKILKGGVVIPAHPLALTKDRKLDEKRQKGLTKYYILSGAGGIAVGVHTTQFEIHRNRALYKKVLSLSIEAIEEEGAKEKIVKISGIYGNKNQVIEEAELSVSSGYDACLVSFSGLKQEKEENLIEIVKEISEIIPVFGFYLQPAVGGMYLSYNFWCKFFEKVENIAGVKIAPFDRYFTIDVVRAVVDTGREKEIPLYTGNDDNIIFDLITPFKVRNKKIRISGGLLGHWAFWTKRTVEIFNTVRKIAKSNQSIPPYILTLAAEITDANGAIFDAKNNFAGCIPGINEVLRRSGLLEGNWCLNKKEKLSPRQKEEIDRIYNVYPHLRDDKFIEKNLDKIFS